MALLKALTTLVPLVAIGIAGIYRYSSYSCAHFDVDFSLAPGKVVIVTGANSGLGLHTARALAAANATVVMACRSEQRCRDAKAEIERSIAYPVAIETLPLDLSSFASITRFVELFRGLHDHVDVLVNNAGIMALPQRETTQDGLEMQIGTNHFGHFLLTALLFPYLERNARIINHSSSAHMFAKTKPVHFVQDDLFSEKSYDPWVAYGNSKLANLYFTYALNRRLSRSENPRNIKAIAVHPGYTSTNLQANRFPLWEYLNALVAMRGEDGALSQIYAAIDPRASASLNDYIGPQFVMIGAPAVQKPEAFAADTEAQDLLWKESVRVTGVDFAIPLSIRYDTIQLDSQQLLHEI